MKQLRKNIEQIANEEGTPVIEVITLLQGQAAKMDNEDLLEMLIELKNEYI